MNSYELLCEREALKMHFLAGENPVPAFVANSLQLWFQSQGRNKTAQDVFYGYGSPLFVISRLMARSRALDGGRKAEETGNASLFSEPFESVVETSRELGVALAEHYGYSNAYTALREFQTPGFTNPFQEKHMHALATQVRKLQNNHEFELPDIPQDRHDKIVESMIRLADLDTKHRVDVMQVRDHPACLGYGGVYKGVKLGLTYNPENPLKSLYNNWHEIGHACYRQHIPQDQFIAGRAMDESIAFMFEYAVGYQDSFLQFLLDEGLSECGYSITMLQDAIRDVNRNTRRIDTNPLRHPIDIYVHGEFERRIINGDQDQDIEEVIFADILAPFKDIFPDDYTFYQDGHTKGGVFGDREAYNSGYAGAFQIGQAFQIDMNNLTKTIRYIAQNNHNRFDNAIKYLTNTPLSIQHYRDWVKNIYGV